MPDTPTPETEPLLSERARDAVHNILSLYRTHVGPDDAIANVAIEEARWLLEELDAQVNREVLAVASIAQALFTRHNPGVAPLSATDEQVARYMADAREAFRLAAVGYNHG